MIHLIDKAAVVAEINKRITDAPINNIGHQRVWAYNDVKDIIDTLEVIDPFELRVQYPSVKDAIQAHAEIYSFNIESHLFPQLTKEQQALWRKEIEQACISGGEVGVELARDIRYKENLEVKEVDFDAEWKRYFEHRGEMATVNVKHLAKYFFELGMAVSNKAQKGE